jgi:hypothetical protein
MKALFACQAARINMWGREPNLWEIIAQMKIFLQGESLPKD